MMQRAMITNPEHKHFGQTVYLTGRIENVDGHLQREVKAEDGQLFTVSEKDIRRL